MKKLVVFAITCLSIIGMNAQDAKSLLNEVSSKVRGYENIQIDFKYNLNNAKENVNQDARGDVTLKGDKYVLNMMGIR